MNPWQVRSSSATIRISSAPTSVRGIKARVDGTLRYLEKERAGAEPRHLAAMVAFAQHAYRRARQVGRIAEIARGERRRLVGLAGVATRLVGQLAHGQRQWVELGLG